MRYLFIVLIFIISFSVNSQVLNLGDPEFKGNIESVIEKSKGYPDDWREFKFDSLSRLIEKKSFRNGKQLEVVRWRYVASGLVSITTEQTGDRLYTRKSYYDEDNRLVKYELFPPGDAVCPKITETNINYTGRQILSFNRFLFNNCDTSAIELYKFEYSPDQSKIVIRKNENKNASSQVIKLKFDKKGNLVSRIIDNNNPLAAVSGVRAWSKSRPDKYRIDYKYDKSGNWINSYAKTRFRKYKLNSRIIKYK